MKKLSYSIFVYLLLGMFSVSCSNDATEEKSPQTEHTQEEKIIAEEKPLSIIKDTIPEIKDTVKYTTNKAGCIELTWKHLAEVDFEERFTEEVGTYVPYPIFRPSVKRIEGKKVEIEGYIIPVEETGEESIIVLSANPFSACFFCGMAGPETIMDIKLKKKFKNKFKQDDILTFRGKLRLNDTDLYYLNYILEEAELVE